MAAVGTLRQKKGWRLTRIAVGLAALGLATYVGGFFLFTAELDRTPPAEIAAADGIVALTGGPDRITAAYRLLEQGKGKRLLITGVHPDVSARSLKEIVPGEALKFDCCVDVGHMAENTIGNADETAEWVRRRDYRSIILVTSTYHLPRAKLELQRAMPDVEIRPFPVFQDTLHLDGWWAYPGTTRLLVSEYTKYLLTLTYGRQSSMPS
ncbi:YdcF family protein [Parvibaculum sp.]|uniref:YdcF family protein n=1 Tax=Parvibaculum sp. TaxID=2024848 RepID=UPI001B13852C|nr:YdcF family protein [Parvibaculum sp.]MBO6668712.1 YdcF family protein [Parvibaculum sp.]MBO6691270.1 YdcF family protein [Parvibaculum sp.]MBO6714389.1 YdcF family protein [Parvibaculum sp.]